MYAANAPRVSLRRQPTASINFITCHDGFTLNDLVSYDVERNGPNLEPQAPDPDANRSWNCGTPDQDGPTADANIAALRRRQQRNFLTTLLISRGVPMLLAGDERGRTQLGNNNAYCQDNEISWMDWSYGADGRNLSGLLRTLIALRARTPTLRAPRFPASGLTEPSEPVPGTGLEWFRPDDLFR